MAIDNSLHEVSDSATGGRQTHRTPAAYALATVLLAIVAAILSLRCTATSVADVLTPPSSSTGYHAAFDRGAPVMGGDPWDLTQADGAITGTDFFEALAQFGHTCA